MYVSISITALAVTLATATAATAATKAKIVVSLEVPHDNAPQYVCVVTQGGGCDKDCRKLEKLTGYLRIDGEIVAPKPAPQPIDNLPQALEAALRALNRGDASQCTDQRCRPSIQIHRQDPTRNPTLSGNLNCTHNVRNTGSDRVAFVSLDYHKRSVKVGVESLELFGTELTVQLLHDSDPKDFAFLIGIGGDYSSDRTRIATRERAQLTLVPRCAMYSLELPPRQATPDESLSVTLNGAELKTCNRPGSTAPSVQIPAQATGSQSTMAVEVSALGEISKGRYETSWTEPLPARPLQLRHRMVELEWSRHCLTGSIPDASALGEARNELHWSIPYERSGPLWTDLCPRAELTVAGASCTITTSQETRCRYRCEAPPSMPAFSLPTAVRFTREGDQVLIRLNEGSQTRSRQHVTVLSWEDTLTYAGQRLDSFVPAAERAVVVAYADPVAWIGTARRPLEVLEVARPGASRHTISLKSAERPNWELVASPHASCSDIFDGNVRGWRRYATRSLVRANTGNLEIAKPDTFAPILDDLSLIVGVGFTGPQLQQAGGKLLVQPIGITLSTKDRAFSGAWELSLLYELTRVPFSALHPKGAQEGEAQPSVFYQRFMGEISYLLRLCLPGRCSTRFLWGFTLGLGTGGPILPETQKVGALSGYWLSNLFVRWKLGERWFADIVGTMRVGERHRSFGFEVEHASVDQTFVGHPRVTDNSIVHLGFFLRIHWSVR